MRKEHKFHLNEWLCHLARIFYILRDNEEFPFTNQILLTEFFCSSLDPNNHAMPTNHLC